MYCVMLTRFELAKGLSCSVTCLHIAVMAISQFFIVASVDAIYRDDPCSSTHAIHFQSYQTHKLRSSKPFYVPGYTPGPLL